MTLPLANAPCSWGVEFAGDPRNPPWRAVLRDCAAAGYGGIELGPVGYMPEDPAELGAALAEEGLALVAGVVFRPFHDPGAWAEVEDAARRTARALAAHGARHMVLIDSISPRRAPTAGRPAEAPRLDAADWAGLRDRVAAAARIGAEEHGLTVTLHPHAGGFLDFADEVDRLLDEVDADLLGLCPDTGHLAYAGADPAGTIRRHGARVRYVHLKDVDPAVKARAIARRTGFYEACGQGLFCHLGEGEVELGAVRAALGAIGYAGWATVEQDCDPTLGGDPAGDARANLDRLRAAGF